MSTEPPKPPEDTPPRNSGLRIFLQLVFALVTLGGAVALGAYYLKTPPKAQPRQRTPIAPLVTVTKLVPQDVVYEFDAMGTVISAKEIQIYPQVSGEITGISENLVPGGYFNTGDQLLSIDPSDYRLAAMQLESSLAKAESDLNLEMGNQRIALKEFEILGEKVSDAEKQLMLRAPQLDAAKATVASAKAQLEKAQMDLARTKIRAPFNGVVLSRSVNIGSRVTTSTPLANVVGTDQFWVKVSLPVRQLRWLKIPMQRSDKGSAAGIYLNSSDNSPRRGEIIRLAPDLEEQGRMAVVYVAVDDPLCLKAENHEAPQLLLGSFVRVHFQGRNIQDVNVIGRDYLHEGNTLWFLTADNTLAIEPVDVIGKTKDYVYISADQGKNRQIVTSAIATPAPGTPLRIAGQEKGEKGDQGEGGRAKRQAAAAESDK